MNDFARMNGPVGYASCTADGGGTSFGPLNGGSGTTIINDFPGSWATPYWTIIPPAPRKSSACPHCTPKCPHGYPADDAPSVSTYPTVTWTYGSWGASAANVTAKETK